MPTVNQHSAKLQRLGHRLRALEDATAAARAALVKEVHASDVDDMPRPQIAAASGWSLSQIRLVANQNPNRPQRTTGRQRAKSTT